MIFTSADRDLAEALFSAVAKETASPTGGVCRPSYSLEETAAGSILATAANDLGLFTRADNAGNLVLSHLLPITDVWPRSIVIGSHLDSVPSGGNYDGLAGVVAALLLVAKARDKKILTPHILGLGLRGEESAWFGAPYLGSKAVVGKLSRQDLQRLRRSVPTDAKDSDVPVSLEECMRGIDASPEKVVETPSMPRGMLGEFWELHIEQGPVLAAHNRPVGIVTGICGNARAPRALVRGRAGHSGTTPHELRNDAVIRFVEVMTKLEARRKDLATRGTNVVFTCGMVNTDPEKHSITTIADEIRLGLDVRSIHVEDASRFLTYAEICGVDLGEIVMTPGAMLNYPMRQRAESACRSLGIEPQIMPSGAGHDASVFEIAGVPSGMIFVRNENGSHNPAEAMSTDDFLLGCEVLWKTIMGDTR